MKTKRKVHMNCGLGVSHEKSCCKHLMCTHVGVAGHVAEIFTVAGQFSDFLLPNSVNFYDFAVSTE